MHGVLNIDKPSGITSHDVVQQVRRLFREKRVGHTGTLDPSATGVLVLCVGKATRIAQYLEAGVKEYRAVMRLGVTTDTLDADGQVLERRQYRSPDKEQLSAVLNSFQGSLLQRPPVFSAIKVRGVPSYKLARQGKAKPLEPRRVTIDRIELIDYNDPLIAIKVTCSKGVYIRTLCADIGEALGCGAHLSNLVRTRSGVFRIEEAVNLDQLASRPVDSLETALISMEKALESVPALIVTGDEAKKIAQGNRIPAPDGFWEEGEVLLRIHDQNGLFVALAFSHDGQIRPETVFV